MLGLNNRSLWPKATGLLFNFHKCIVLLYGNNNPNFECTLCEQVLSTVDSAKDLGFIRATNLSHNELRNNIIRCANLWVLLFYVLLLRVMHFLCLVFLLLTSGLS